MVMESWTICRHQRLYTCDIPQNGRTTPANYCPSAKVLELYSPQMARSLVTRPVDTKMKVAQAMCSSGSFYLTWT